MLEKRNIVILVLIVSLLVLFASCSEEAKSGKISKSSNATPLPPEMIKPGAGLVKLEPADSTVKKGNDFAVEIHVNTGTQKVAAYGFVLTFDPAVIDVIGSKGTNGVDALPDGFVQAVNATKRGEVFAAGFDVYGKGPSDDLGIAKVSFKAVGQGQTSIGLEVRSLFDEKSNPLGNPQGEGAQVSVN
jgi:hypothetical protein